MTSDQYTELIDFLGRNLDAVERRFDVIEHRMSTLEVSQEAMREDDRALEGRSRSARPTRHPDGGGDFGPGREPMMSPHQFDCLMAYLNWWFDRLAGRPDAVRITAEPAATVEARIQSNVDSARRRLEASRHRG